MSDPQALEELLERAEEWFAVTGIEDVPVELAADLLSAIRDLQGELERERAMLQGNWDDEIRACARAEGECDQLREALREMVAAVDTKFDELNDWQPLVTSNGRWEERANGAAVVRQIVHDRARVLLAQVAPADQKEEQ